MLAAASAPALARARHFFYGGAPDVAARMIETLRRRNPDLIVAGALSPPFRAQTPAEIDADLEAIEAAAPDIVWVGLGSPRQEVWMATHRPRLGAAILIGVGAAFDLHGGAKPQAPAWMRARGLEWLFRLATEPRRLWRRYAVTVPLFLIFSLLEAVGLWRPPPIRD